MINFTVLQYNSVYIFSSGTKKILINFLLTGGLLMSSGHYLGFNGYIAKPIPRPTPGFTTAAHLHHSLLACRQPYLTGKLGKILFFLLIFKNQVVIKE